MLKYAKRTRKVVIADLKGWGYSNSDIRGMLGALSILQDYYPERLGKLFIVHVPYIFMKVWKIVYPFMDKNTQKKAGEGEDNYICRIVEMFEGVDATPYITAQWFYRAKDNVITTCSNLVDDKRVFLSTIKDDNPLDCLLEKIKIVQLPLNVVLVSAQSFYPFQFH